MKAKKSYVVHFERDETGMWIAEAAGLAGCVTQGRTIATATERIREAIQAVLDLPAPFAGEIIVDVALPKPTKDAVRSARIARAAADKAEAEASAASIEVLQKLKSHGLSLADAGGLIGISRQRAHQILGGAKPGKKPAASGRPRRMGAAG